MHKYLITQPYNMKTLLSFFVAILCGVSVYAQTNTVSLSGKLDSKVKIAVIHLQNIDGVDISIPVDAQNNFAFKSDSLVKGFYEVDKIGTVYICPGYQLTIQPDKEGTYVFKGKGALENNALVIAKQQLKTFLPVTNESGIFGELSQAAYYLEPTVFLQKLDSFQKKGILIFNASNDTLFQKYAALNLEFYGNQLLLNYLQYYGWDQVKFMKFSEMLEKLDSKSPDYMKNMTSLWTSMGQSFIVKQMDNDDRIKVMELVYNKWDKGNEMLFRNSVWYRQALKNYITFISPKYRTTDDLLGKRTSPMVKELNAARGEIKNSYILAYFDHNFTSTILKETKDTAALSKYYNEYLMRSSRQDYLLDIKKIYSNTITYANNSPAPEFSFKDGLDHSVSLKSLHGKFVYIDVWATWCGPCKAEMPSLKELEAAYKGKNIEFVSISVDKQLDKNLWKEFVKNNSLKGIQLISDNAFETAFVEKMNINSIPRFILIDPAGKLIAADAMRPSNKELKPFLDKLL